MVILFKYNLLQVEIRKLQDKKQVIIGEIKQVEIKIGELEADQKHYQEMLYKTKNYKKDFEEYYKITEKKHKNLIISKLNSLYEIASAEGG
ncbi:MAG: hypothetical protein Q8807_02505 ['Waltheria sp.' little leaf phytoplasma]|nr:hypothetical protein ['Waltheria sp.' little leaf phytoplasma]